MLEVPSRDTLATLHDAANAVVPTPIVGLARRLDGGRVSVVFSHARGIGEYVLDLAEVPDALLPRAHGARHAVGAPTGSAAGGAIDWQLNAVDAHSLFSVPVPAVEPLTRAWIGLADDQALATDEIRRLESLGALGADLLGAPIAPGAAAERQHRLELAAGLLPALLRVLDVREVFEHLSHISREALPHDMLTLGLFDENLSQLTMYASTGERPDVGRVFPHPYPPAVTRGWNFDILDDRTPTAIDFDRPPTWEGMRSSLRLPLRFDDRVIGGLGFNSREPGRYASADVAIGRRLADHVALALSHYMLAQRAADEARRHEEARARAEKSDLLDEVLASVTGAGELPDVFDRISNATQKVLAHDALSLIELLPNRRQGRVYASQGLGTGTLPTIMDAPPVVQANPDWQFDIVDDVQAKADELNIGAARAGYRSVLRVPIRFDNELVAGMSFLSRTPGRYSAVDVPIARRIADRVALSLARERGAVLTRRADEAAARASQLESRVRALTEELDARTGYRRVVGESAQWRQVLTQATQVASTETTVLLLGESGTGKEVVARFLHRASPRSNGPFVALNCAALPEQLLEAELFGYERGAYTGATQSKPGQLEQAAGGTLFLDEVGEMSLQAQAKFLRVLQEREFQRLGGTRVLRTDARIVAATNRDLQRAIANRQFREDLYYRLDVFAIRLPALRDRREDILPLSQAFLAEISRGLGRPPAGISREARQLLTEYQWPGNVRELRNILERAAILCEGGLITGELLSLKVSSPPAAAPASAPPPVRTGAAPSSAEDLQMMERAMIEQALQSARFNKSRAAKALGLTRHQLYIRMRKHGLE